jgi:hypothetical protein
MRFRRRCILEVERSAPPDTWFTVHPLPQVTARTMLSPLHE